MFALLIYSFLVRPVIQFILGLSASETPQQKKNRPTTSRLLIATVFLLSIGLCQAWYDHVRPAVRPSSPFTTLAVSSSAPRKLIAQRSRLLLSKFHPDRDKSAEAKVSFDQIRRASSILLHESRRDLYTNFGDVFSVAENLDQNTINFFSDPKYIFSIIGTRCAASFVHTLVVTELICSAVGAKSGRQFYVLCHLLIALADILVRFPKASLDPLGSWMDNFNLLNSFEMKFNETSFGQSSSAPVFLLPESVRKFSILNLIPQINTLASFEIAAVLSGLTSLVTSFSVFLGEHFEDLADSFATENKESSKELLEDELSEAVNCADFRCFPARYGVDDRLLKNNIIMIILRSEFPKLIQLSVLFIHHSSLQHLTRELKSPNIKISKTPAVAKSVPSFNPLQLLFSLVYGSSFESNDVKTDDQLLLEPLTLEDAKLELDSCESEIVNMVRSQTSRAKWQTGAIVVYLLMVTVQSILSS